MPRFLVSLPVLLFALVCLSADRAHAQAARGPTKPLLVSEFPCPDPHIVRDGSDWYVFGTGAEPFFLQGKELGEGKMRRVFLDINYRGFPARVEQIWGFIVYRHTDGTYHGYGTLHLGGYRTVIAYFAPRGSEKWEDGRPITKWDFQRLLVGDLERQDWKYYESKIVPDTDGTLYLMFAANVGRDNHILAQRMKTPAEIDADAPRRLLLNPEGYRSEDRDEPGGMQLVEGGSIFKHEGKYILLYSVGNYQKDNYKLGMAVSNALIPPPGHEYRKAKLPDPERVWGVSDHEDEVLYVLQSQKAAWPNDSRAFVVGPGLGSLVPDGKELWLFFHGYKPDDRERKPENRFVFRTRVKLAAEAGGVILRWRSPGLTETKAAEAFPPRPRNQPTATCGF
jgi:hypothetical protein